MLCCSEALLTVTLGPWRGIFRDLDFEIGNDLSIYTRDTDLAARAVRLHQGGHVLVARFGLSCVRRCFAPVLLLLLQRLQRQGLDENTSAPVADISP